MTNPNQVILDNILNNALEMFRLMAAERGSIFKKLEELKKQLVAELATTGELNSRAKIDRFTAKADSIVQEQYTAIQQELDFKEIGKYVAEQTGAGLAIALGRQALKLPTNDYFKSLASDFLILGAPSDAWWLGQSEDLKFKFRQQLRQGLSEGETNQQIISRVVGKAGQPGIMETARRNAAALVQTSVQAVANDARRNTFLANDDVINGIEQISTLDGHTSLICISYSGCKWNFEDGGYKPFGPNSKPYGGGVPRHWNCRSVEVPVLKSLEELGFKNIPKLAPGERASASGPIAADTTFDSYLQRRGKAYQDDMLGPGRAELWREGKITLRDLVDGNGRPLSLGELQAKAGRRQAAQFSGADYRAKFDDASATPDGILDTFPADTRAKITDVRRKLSQLTETDKIYKIDGDYTPGRLDLHRRILYEGVEGYDPETGGSKWYPGLLNPDAVSKALPEAGQKPTFTILGGRGGSGKSAFSGVDDEGNVKFPEAKVYDKNKAIVFDSDHVKHMLPEFKGFNAGQVHNESSEILARAMNEAKELKLNTVLDGTLKSDASDKVKLYRDSGYRTEAHYMHLPRQEAAKRAVQRFLGKTGRYVPMLQTDLHTCRMPGEK